MQRSSKDAWLTGPGDLKEADVDDVPVAGESVRVRALSARYSAEVQGQLKLVQDGRDQVATIDVAAMERLQFQFGVIDPEFTAKEVAQIQERFGSAFRKVVSEIDRLSGIDKEAIEATEQRFPDGGTDAPGEDESDGSAAGNGGPAVHARTGA
jgi:hypothetical protein